MLINVGYNECIAWLVQVLSSHSSTIDHAKIPSVGQRRRHIDKVPIVANRVTYICIMHIIPSSFFLWSKAQ